MEMSLPARRSTVLHHLHSRQAEGGEDGAEQEGTIDARQH